MKTEQSDFNQWQENISIYANKMNKISFKVTKYDKAKKKL